LKANPRSRDDWSGEIEKAGAEKRKLAAKMKTVSSRLRMPEIRNFANVA